MTQLYSELPSFSELEKSDVKPARAGGFIVYFNLPGKQPLRFQIGTLAGSKTLRVPFGHQRSAPPGTPCDENKRVVEAELTDPELKAFFERFDAHNIEYALEHRAELFGSEVDPAVVKALYKSPIIRSKNPDYPDRVKIRVYKETVGKRQATEIYTYKTKGGQGQYRPSTVDCIDKGSEGIFVVWCSGLWIISRQWGATVNCSSALIMENRRDNNPGFNWKGTEEPQLVSMDTDADDGENPLAESDFAQVLTNGSGGSDDYVRTMSS